MPIIESIPGTRVKMYLWRPGYAAEVARDDAKIAAPADTYGLVPLVLRAVQLRVEAIRSIPIFVTDRRGNETEWPFGDLSNAIARAEFDLLLWGAAYWLKLRNRLRVTGLQRLHPSTITVEVLSAEGPSPQYQFFQRANGREYGPWARDEVVHFWEPNPQADIGPGPSAAAVASGNARLLHYLTVFAEKFFESGAMPLTLISVRGPITPAERERVETWFRRAVSGIRRAFRVLALGADAEVETITQPLREMALPELHEQARRSVALAFGIPQTMLEDAANYATAREHRRSFWAETVRPRARFLEAVVNEQLAGPLGLQVRLDVDALDIFQEDEAKRAASLQALVGAGVPMGLAMQMLGMELPEGWEYDPDTGEPRRAVQATEPGGFRADLRRWERKALKRAKAGKSAAVDFHSDYIPPTFAEAIRGALEVAEGARAVRMVFRMAERRLPYPTSWEGYP